MKQIIKKGYTTEAKRIIVRALGARVKRRAAEAAPGKSAFFHGEWASKFSCHSKSTVRASRENCNRYFRHLSFGSLVCPISQLFGSSSLLCWRLKKPKALTTSLSFRYFISQVKNLLCKKLYFNFFC